MTGRLHHLWAALLPLVLVGCGADEGPRDGRPAAPTNVSVSAEHGIVTVAWEHDGVDTKGYRVSRQTVTGSAAFGPLAEVLGEVGPEARAYLDATVEIGVAYSYSVAALGEASASDAATTTEAVTAGSGVSVSVGTYMVPLYDQPELAVGLFTYLSQEEIAEVSGPSITVTGPPGWNDDQPVSFGVPLAFFEAGFGWFTMGQAVAGPYTFEVDTGAETFTRTATLPSLDTLPYPTGVTVESHSPTVVVGSWDAHPEAVSYTAALFAGTYDAPTQVAFAHTAATEHTLSGLQLEPGQYFLAVYAYPVDRTAPHRLMPPARFDVALDASGYFQVE